MGICLPSNSSYYKIKICIGDFEMQSGWPKEYRQGYNRFSERFPQQVMNTPYPSIEQMENIFVYLMDGSYPICYWKGKMTDFMDPNPKFQWLTMKNDRAVGSVSEDHEAGMLQFKLSIHPKHMDGPIDFN